MCCFIRKVTVFFLVLLIVCDVCYAASISGEGTGNTRTEALEEARHNLASKITVRVSSISYSGYFDDGKKSKSKVGLQEMSTTGFELIGAVEEVTQTDGKYFAKCTLPPASARSYAEKTKDLDASIIKLRQMMEEQTDEVKISGYPQLIAMQRKAELFRYVVNVLTDGKNETQLLTSGSSEASEAEYKMLLSKSIVEKNIQIKNLENQIQLGVASAEAARKIEDFKKEVSETRAIYMDLRAEKQRDLTAMIDELGFDYALLTDRLSAENVPSLSNSLGDDISTLESYRNTFFLLKDNLDRNLATLIETYKEDRNTAIHTALSIGFAPSQLDRNGRPTDDAVSFLENAVQKDIDRLVKKYRGASSEVYSIGMKHLKSMSAKASSKIAEINKKTYTLKDGTYGMSCYVDGYGFDYDTMSWIGTVTVAVGMGDISFSFVLPYEKLTGESVKAEDIAGYSRLRESIEAWSEVLSRMGSEILDITLKTKAEAKKSSSDYIFTLENCTVRRADTKKVISSSGKKQTFEMSMNEERVDIDDYGLKNTMFLD
ncbi:MAG: hypothetical protein MJ052_05290 [Sphaerochaetaceae bacterium]|nr:hypothetical protein [Sphaerochaetaceae bacterium]